MLALQKKLALLWLEVAFYTQLCMLEQCAEDLAYAMKQIDETVEQMFTFEEVQPQKEVSQADVNAYLNLAIG